MRPRTKRRQLSAFDRERYIDRRAKFIAPLDECKAFQLAALSLRPSPHYSFWLDLISSEGAHLDRATQAEKRRLEC